MDCQRSGAQGNHFSRFSGSLRRDHLGYPVTERALNHAVTIDFGILDIPTIHATPASHPEAPHFILHVDKMIHHHQAIASVTIHCGPPFSEESITCLPHHPLMSIFAMSLLYLFPRFRNLR